MAQLGIASAIHVENGWQRDDPAGETRWLASLPEGPGKPRAIVAHADVSDPGLDTLLDAHLAEGPVVGIRQILNRHKEPRLTAVPVGELLGDQQWRKGFAKIVRRGLCFDLQVYPPQLGDAAILARSFPEARIILEHAGMPIDRSPAALSDWKAGLEGLAQAGNVWVKLSGGFLGQSATDANLALELYREVLALFPANRVLLGTNLPVDRLYGGAARIAEVWSLLIAKMPEGEARLLCRENAIEAYHLAG